MNRVSFIFLVFPLLLSAQDKTVDSLKLVFKTAKHDTTRCAVLSKLIEFESDSKIWLPYNDQLQAIADTNSKTAPTDALKKIYIKHLSGALNNKGFFCEQEGKISDALNYYHMAMQLQLKVNDKEGLANSFHNIAFIYRNEGKHKKALEYNLKALKIRKEINNKVGIASSLNMIGIIFQSQGNLPDALEYFHKAMKTGEGSGDKIGLANALNNIGNLYSNQGNYIPAMEHLVRSLKLNEEIQDRSAVSLILTNIGFIHLQLREFEQALDYYHRSLKIREDISDKKGIAHNLNDIGFVYDMKEDYTRAFIYFEKSMHLQEEINDKSGLATSFNNLGDAMLQLGRVNDALAYANRSMQLAKELGVPEDMMCAAVTLKAIYKKQHKYKDALVMYELCIEMRDSIESEEAKKAGLKQQFRYEYEKKAAADSVRHTEEQKVKNAQLKAQHAQLKQEKTQRLALYGGLGIVIAFLGFVYNRFKVTQKQKLIIENQKITVDTALGNLEIKNKEILDSIHYAKRIQTALLTSEKYIERKLNELN